MYEVRSLALIGVLTAPRRHSTVQQMIFEIRTYTTKPGLRDRFVEFLQNESAPVHQRVGIMLIGPFFDLENQNTVVCLRGFPNLEERERMRHSFYGGPEWKGGLKAKAMAMLDNYKVVLTEVRASAAVVQDQIMGVNSPPASAEFSA